MATSSSKQAVILIASIIVAGIMLHILSLVMHAFVYSSFTSIDIFEYCGRTRSWPVMLIPITFLIISALFFDNRHLSLVLMIAALVVLYDGVLWIDYGTAILHGNPALRESQEKLLHIAQLVRFAGGVALLTGSIILFRTRRKAL